MEKNSRLQEKFEKMSLNFDGVIFKNKKIAHLCFSNKNEKIEIPVDRRVGTQILMHLQKIAPPPLKLVEWGNDEPSK